MAATGNVRYSQIRSGDRTGNGARLVTAASGTLTQNVPLLYDANGNVVATATRSGNTTEFATVSGTKTTGKQLQFDVDGNIEASAFDAGAGGGGGGTLTPPTDSGFSWVNQGSATYAASSIGILVVVPGSATPNHRLRVKSLPSAPYTITVALSCFGKASNYGITGIYLRDSASGKLIAFGIGYGHPGVSGVANGISCSKWTNPTTYSADYSTGQLMPHGEGPIWLQIEDDATNRNYSLVLGGDTTNRIVLLTTTNTDFLTADEWGFGGNSENSNKVGTYLKSLDIS